MPRKKGSSKERPGKPSEGASHQDASHLRRLAEEKVLTFEQGDEAPLSPEETRRALHELRVHRIELEMQNEELRRIQGELEASRARYFDLYDLAPVSYLTISAAGLILEANLTATALLATPRSRLVKRPLSRFILPEDQDVFFRSMGALSKTGARQSCEVRFLRANKEPFCALLEATREERHEGSDPGVARITLNEITGRKLLEQELSESEEKFRSIFDNAQVGILFTQRDGAIFTANAAACEMTGYSVDELRQGGRDIVVDLNDPRLPGMLQETDRTGRFQGEHNFKKKDGSVFPAEVFVSAFHLQDGTFKGIVIFRDISERKRMEMEIRDAHLHLEAHVQERTAELHAANEALVDENARRKQAEDSLWQSEERFRQIAENIREVFWVRTAEEILYISPAYEEVWGRSRESLYESPNSFLDIVHPEDKERVTKANQADIEGVSPLDEQYRIVRQGGAIRWIWDRSFPICEQGKLVRIVGIAEDITVRKEAETFLRIERDLALRLGSTTSLTEALETLLEACLELDSLDCVGIYVVDLEAGELKLLCHRGLSEAFLERISVFDLSSPQGCYAMRGEPAYWTEPITVFEMAALFKAEGLRALVCVPVTSDGALVAVLNAGSHAHGEISPSIRTLIGSLASRMGEIISRVRLGETVKTQRAHLEESNAALRALLRQREHDRADLEESFVSNVKHLILPYLDKLKGSRLTHDQRLLFDILESHLHEITSPFVRKLSSSLIGLTPMEIRVAELIRQGKSSKEIADLLVTSEHTVIFHRQGIRRKLGLIGKSINLQTYLSSLL